MELNVPTAAEMRTIIQDAVREECVAMLARAERPGWMTREECAEHLRVHPDTVTKLRKLGRIPATKISRERWIFNRASVDAALLGVVSIRRSA